MFSTSKISALTGATGATGAQGIQGVQGVQGDAGADGDDYSLAADQTWTGSQRGAVVAVGLDSSSPIKNAVADMDSGNNFLLTMSGDAILSFNFRPASNSVGQSGVIRIVHDGNALTFSTALRWEGGIPTVGTTGTDFLAYFVVEDDSGSEYALCTYFLAPANT